MGIPKAAVNLIIDHLASVLSDTQRQECLRNASLVSTAWVDRCQHHLFSTVSLPYGPLRKWCSRIRHGDRGVSRHVRILYLNWWDAYWTPVICYSEPELPHLTSFRNLQELWIDHVDGNIPPRSSLRLRVVLGYLGTQGTMAPWGPSPLSSTVYQTLWTSSCQIFLLTTPNKSRPLPSPASNCHMMQSVSIFSNSNISSSKNSALAASPLIRHCSSHIVGLTSELLICGVCLCWALVSKLSE